METSHDETYECSIGVLGEERIEDPGVGKPGRSIRGGSLGFSKTQGVSKKYQGDQTTFKGLTLL